MSRQIRVSLGKKYRERYFTLPNLANTLLAPNGESLMYFGQSDETDKKSTQQFFGIGMVYRVVHRKEDEYIIMVNFSYRMKNNCRWVICSSNQAKRQTLTLKRGQPCMVWGIVKFYGKYIENDKGEQEFKRCVGLYASGVQGWYVPTMKDIKKMPKNTDIEISNEGNEEYLNYLDQFEMTQGED